MAFKYKDYEKSDEVQRLGKVASQSQNYVASGKVQQARENMYKNEANKPTEWNGGTYGEALKGALDKIQNREKFSYDLNADALYQQYKDKYISQGKLAMQDTLGQASALTGGYGNSYAATAGNQAYQSYLQKLNDIVPELYNAAYTRYRDEGNDLKDQYNILANQYGIEYGESRDKMADWQNEQNRLTNLYYNEAEMDYDRFKDRRDTANDLYNRERAFDYGIYQDAYANAMNAYKQGVAEDQYNRDLALNYAKLNQDQSQFDDNLALNYAKLLQDQNQFNEQMALNRDKYNTSLDQYKDSLAQYDREMALKELQEQNDYDLKMAELGYKYTPEKGQERLPSEFTTMKEWKQYLKDVVEDDGAEAAMMELDRYFNGVNGYSQFEEQDLVSLKAWLAAYAGKKQPPSGKTKTAELMEQREDLNNRTQTLGNIKNINGVFDSAATEMVEGAVKNSAISAYLKNKKQ